MQNQYYVYVCYVNQKPVYVGKGKGSRYKHCTSGKSHNLKLNQALLEYGKEAFETKFIYEYLDEQESLRLERKLIISLLNYRQKIFNNDPQTLWYAQHDLPPLQFYEQPIPEWVTEEIL